MSYSAIFEACDKPNRKCSVNLIMLFLNYGILALLKLPNKIFELQSYFELDSFS